MSRELFEFSRDIDEHFVFQGSLFDEVLEVLFRWIR